MPDPVTHSTFTIERSYPHPPERIFAALSDPAKKRRWFAESAQHEVLDYSSDFRPGGEERLRYRFTGDAPIKNMVLDNRGRFEAIVPDVRVVTSGSMMLGDAVVSTSLVTMELFGEGSATQLRCTFQGAFYEGSDGPQMRRMGWQILLERLGEAL